MPCKPQKARRLLKEGKATVVKHEPFTLRLNYGSAGYKQPITLGIDTGSVHIGISASTKKTRIVRFGNGYAFWRWQSFHCKAPC